MGVGGEGSSERRVRKSAALRSSARTHQDVARLEAVGERHPHEVAKDEHEPESAQANSQPGEKLFCGLNNKSRVRCAHKAAIVSACAPVCGDVHRRQDRGLVRHRVEDVYGLEQAHLQETRSHVTVSPPGQAHSGRRGRAGAWMQRKRVKATRQSHRERHRPRLLVLRRRKCKVEEQPERQPRGELAPLLPVEPAQPAQDAASAPRERAAFERKARERQLRRVMGRPSPGVKLATDEEIVDMAASVAAGGEEVLPAAERAQVEVEGKAEAEEDAPREQLLREITPEAGGRFKKGDPSLPRTSLMHLAGGRRLTRASMKTQSNHFRLDVRRVSVSAPGSACGQLSGQ